LGLIYLMFESIPGLEVPSWTINIKSGPADGCSRSNISEAIPMRDPSVPLAIILLLPAIMIVSGGAESADDGSGIAEWTFMVYLDADNNLESAGVEDFNEMERVGSTEEVNVLVQMDRWETTESDDDTTNGDWKDCRRFRVERDDDTAILNSPVLEEMGEANMGDPQVLIDFVRWGIANYPAENYAIVLWDHGGGYRGICWDDTVPGSDTYDSLELFEIRAALEDIYLFRGSERIELLGFDACLMAQIAVLYEVKDFTSVVDASGFNEPGDGWPYFEVLGPLVERPTMDEKELGALVADAYIESYTDSQSDPDDSIRVSMTAFDMRMMNPLIITIDKFAEELAKPGAGGGINYLIQIYTARAHCNSYDTVPIVIYDLTGYPLYDVYGFTLELEKLVPQAFPGNDRILSLCSEVRNAIDAVRIKGRVSGVYDEKAFGLSMYFPNKESNLLQVRQLPTEYDPKYEETSYSADHLWNDFLHAYYGIDPIEDSLPIIEITSPDYNATFSVDDLSARITGEAYDREGIKKVEVRIDGGQWRELPGIAGQGQIGWVYNLDLGLLEPGRHLIEFRAHDTLSETTEGHVTEPKSIVVTVLEPMAQGGGGIKVPGWTVTILVAVFILVAAVFGFAILKGRDR